MKIRNYCKFPDLLLVPRLTKVQTNSYEDFLQAGIPGDKRKNQGIESILRETFPIQSYDGSMALEYLHYELGKPRYSVEDCKSLGLTYGAPFKVVLRLVKKDMEAVEEEVYLGEMPIMIGGGEFIINGSERVIVSQLHRSPGVDFLEDTRGVERRLYSCRIIPDRGSWIEMNVAKRGVLTVRIDQSGKFPFTIFLRAFAPEFSTNADILRLFYPTERVKLTTRATTPRKLAGKFAAEDITNEETSTVFVETGKKISDATSILIWERGIREVEVITEIDEPLIINTLAEDPTKSHEEALLKIYSRLRPGSPPQLARAKRLFHERFQDANRYRLGRVGRFRLNRKFGSDIPESEMTLLKEDLVGAVRYLMKLLRGEGVVDDIDHLGNRRLRTIGELAGEEIRKGFLRLKRSVQERMSTKEASELTPRLLVNSKTVSAAIDYFFARSELSQVVDQTNPLAELQHERRLSAVGPGGLNRKRAGFEVRDVHVSHYGRICPVETPEGTNIGLISYLSLYADIDDYGFLMTPYRKIRKGRVTDEIEYFRADEEAEKKLVPADVPVDDQRRIKGKRVLARFKGDFQLAAAEELEYADISPRQLVGVSASLIPFLEHNDANRALMGSNMQRQAVPLITPEPPIVATGMEKIVAENSSMVVTAQGPGEVTKVTAYEIVIRNGNGQTQAYRLAKFQPLNEGTCLNQRPIVREGDKVKADQIIADGPATSQGELSLGRNVLVAFMPWEGYNFEDAIIISESLVRDGRYTSIHIQEFEAEIRETRLGREEFTRDIPNVSERALRNLDERGVVRMGTKVGPGDILVGKVSPKSKSELSPEEKLLHAIFGRAGEDVKNNSLVVPSGVEGIVVDTKRFSRKSLLSEEERKRLEEEMERIELEFNKQIAYLVKKMFRSLEELTGGPLISRQTKETISLSGLSIEEIVELQSELDFSDLVIRNKKKKKAAEESFTGFEEKIEVLRDEKEHHLDGLRRGDELPSGVLEMVKVFVATKRTLAVGDKMAGRHGNKGVIAKILPVEDMPFLEDGTSVEIILNPLGVPSRMNLGQIFETHLGWAARALGFQAVCPVFDGATEAEIRQALRQANLPQDGKITLCDGRTGQRFDQKITVGYIYMMKLIHLVDDKIHARATGPYSLITQQPLGGKARYGGQRFGEMEVWALEAYGAAYTLQELLTVKSDDIEGRTKIYEAMVKGTNTLEAGTPVSFDVLTNEIRGLCLNLQLEERKALDR
ncbi:MAG: DNA-directed RNA polymerase subunit beta [Planctomycetes bacterium DG_23]|nr:MAG: DNA-directed RNA polymerase subunit beta [Planctomycetes bacterium DG_23]